MLLALWVGLALAEDPKSDELTLAPLDGASLMVSNAESRVAASLNVIDPGRRGWVANVGLSAPLGEGVQSLDLLDSDRRFQAGFGGDVFIGWDEVHVAFETAATKAGASWVPLSPAALRDALATLEPALADVPLAVIGRRELATEARLRTLMTSTDRDIRDRVGRPLVRHMEASDIADPRVALIDHVGKNIGPVWALSWRLDTDEECDPLDPEAWHAEMVAGFTAAREAWKAADAAWREIERTVETRTRVRAALAGQLALAHDRVTTLELELQRTRAAPLRASIQGRITSVKAEIADLEGQLTDVQPIDLVDPARDHDAAFAAWEKAEARHQRRAAWWAGYQNALLTWDDPRSGEFWARVVHHGETGRAFFAPDARKARGPLVRLGVNLAGDYDLIEGHVGTARLDRDPERFANFLIDAGPQVSLLFDRTFLSLRTGYQQRQRPVVDTVQACSDDGTTCTDEPVLAEAPSATSSAYVRLGGTFFAPDPVSGKVGDTDAKVLPGMDARVGLEGLASDAPTVDWQVAWFVAPVTGPVMSETGIGVRASHWLTAQDDVGAGGFAAFTPFVFVGATILPDR